MRVSFTSLRRRAAAFAVVALIVAVAAPPAGAVDVSESKSLRKAVTVAGIREHQAALQAIADATPDKNRQSGTAGYDASVDYVQGKLEAAGYDVTIQPFTFQLVSDVTPPVFEQVSPNATAYVNGVDYATMTYSGSGDVAAPLARPSGDIRGCAAADWAGFPAGNVALVQRGTPVGQPPCTFRIKAANAVAAGASAVIVFNNAAGLLNGTLGEPRYTHSVIGVTQALGQSLIAQLTSTPVTVHVKTDTVAEERTTYNVIAETATGDPHNVLVVGAHLDSVSRGPGINDNGSGTGTILEIAEQFAAQGRVARNKIRFMWFGAEESGLIGSTRYVASLSQAQRDDIMAMLNFDMVGSPNFVRFVYDGDGSHSSPAGPPGSAWIEDLFVDYFESQGLASSPTQFSGRSDYGPFIAAGVGIPAGGLFTGAEGIKTAEQAAIYGGTAGVAYDPCYHLACDTFANNNNTGLDQMSDAAAHAVLTMSRLKVDITVSTASVSRLAGGAATSGVDEGPHPDHDHEAVDH